MGRDLGVSLRDHASDGSSQRPWGILGGTFDPVHVGHLTIAEQTRQALDLAGVVFVPAALPPHKVGLDISDALARVAMVELAIADNSAFRISRIELDREGPSYTVDTLRQFHERGVICGPGRPDPVLIVSVEAFRALPSWREPGTILDLARVAVVPRRGYPRPDAAAIEASFPGRADRFEVLDGPDLGHAASDIRARVASGRTIRYLVPDAVARYVETHDVYGALSADGGR